MTAQAHTCGPWLAAAKPSSIVGWPVVAPHAFGRSICDIAYARSLTGHELSPQAQAFNDESGANARLIAAAPDFLASARSLIEAWDARTTVAQQIVTGKSDRDLQKQATEAMDGLRAAIAKATGETGE